MGGGASKKRAAAAEKAHAEEEQRRKEAEQIGRQHRERISALEAELAQVSAERDASRAEQDAQASIPKDDPDSAARAALRDAEVAAVLSTVLGAVERDVAATAALEMARERQRLHEAVTAAAMELRRLLSDKFALTKVYSQVRVAVTATRTTTLDAPRVLAAALETLRLECNERELALAVRDLRRGGDADAVAEMSKHPGEEVMREHRAVLDASEYVVAIVDPSAEDTILHFSDAADDGERRGEPLTVSEVRHVLGRKQVSARTVRLFVYFKVAGSATTPSIRPRDLPAVYEQLWDDCATAGAHVASFGADAAATLGDVVAADVWNVVEDDHPFFARIGEPGPGTDMARQEAPPPAVTAEMVSAPAGPLVEMAALFDAHVASFDEPLVVLGGPGCGKTASAFAWLQRRRRMDERQPLLVLTHRAELTPSLGLMLNRLLNVIRTEWDIPCDIPRTTQELIDVFPGWLNMAAARGRVLLLVDDVDLLVDDAGQSIDVGSWMPTRVPPAVRVVLTASVAQAVLDVAAARSWHVHHVRDLTQTEVVCLLETRSEHLSIPITMDEADELSSGRRRRRVPSALFCELLVRAVSMFPMSRAAVVDEVLALQEETAVLEFAINRFLGANEGLANAVTGILSLLLVSRFGLPWDDMVEMLRLESRQADELSKIRHGLLVHLTASTDDGCLVWRGQREREAVEAIVGSATSVTLASWRHMIISLYSARDLTDRTVGELFSQYSHLATNDAGGKVTEHFRSSLVSERVFSRLRSTWQGSYDLVHYWQQLSADRAPAAAATVFTTMVSRMFKRRPAWNSAASFCLEMAAFLSELGADALATATLEELFAYLNGPDTDLRFEPDDVRQEVLGTVEYELAASLAAGEATAMDEATIEHVQHALEARQASLGERDPDTLKVKALLASLLHRRGECERAQTMLDELLADRVAVLGANHVSVANTYDLMQENLIALRRFDDAEQCLRHEARILETAFGADHFDVANAHAKLAALYDLQGRTEKADAYWRESIAMKVAVYGDAHPMVVAAFKERQAAL